MATIASETWTGTTGAAWPAQWTVKSGTATIQANAGRLQSATGALAESSVLLSGMTAYGATDVLVYCTISVQAEHYLLISVDDDGAGTGASGTAYTLDIAVTATAATGSISLFQGLDGAVQITPIITKTLTINVKYGARLRRYGSLLLARLWDSSGSEPTTWDLIARLSGTILTGKVRLGVVNGALTTARFGTFSNLIVDDTAVSLNWTTV